ncbi:hypothetical protein ACP275_14G172700 [Erythranthe tilingii]
MQAPVTTPPPNYSTGLGRGATAALTAHSDIEGNDSYDDYGNESWRNNKKRRFDSFLADLDELSDSEDDLDMVEDIDTDGELRGIEEALNCYDDLDSVLKLENSQRFTETMVKIEEALEKGSENSLDQAILLEEDDNSEYQLLVDCIGLSADIENEISIIHGFIRDKYRSKFPELESLVHHPIDYARVVKKIGNEVDLTLVDLQGLLPSAIVMVVSVTASTTCGKPLPEHVLHKTIDACDRALSLDSARGKVLAFVESRMEIIAPNLCAVVGSAVAAKLMVTAGGLPELAKLRPCNVRLLGAKRESLAGFSKEFRVGYVEETELYKGTPPLLRNRACRVIASKATLAARVDSAGTDSSGKDGRKFRAEIEKSIEKWQEAPPAKRPKPLPVPNSEPKKKRGGRRLMKKKEKYGMTEIRKLANRMEFGVAEESSLGDGIGQGYGMLGKAGVRVSVCKRRLLGDKVDKKKFSKGRDYHGATCGFTSSLAGIELSNPHVKNELCGGGGGGTESTYFSKAGTFSRVKRT